MTTPPILVVVVPGLGRTKVDSFVTRLRQNHPEFRVELFDHRISPLSTRHKLDRVVSSLSGAIRGWAGDNSGERAQTRSVILIGHSIGGILVRAAFLEGAGFGSEPPDAQPDGWATKVDRIVLLGSPNAGYRVENFPKSWRWAVPLLSGFASFTMESVAAGAFWLADLRLRWLHAMRSLEPRRGAEPAGRPLVVQVFGDDDDLVTRKDIDDSAYMPDTVRTGVSNADHAGLVDLTDPATAPQRWSELEHAVIGAFTNAEDHTPQSPAPVHFILHGIRSSAYEGWIAQLTAALRTGSPHPSADLGPQPPQVVSLNYRFFSAIEFALPFTRRRNVHQFLDAYMATVLTHSADRFTFTGHSNGTYMMASIMRSVRSVRFRRILLAGTVLPPAFDWATLYARRQIGHFSGEDWEDGQVHTDRARIDVPVGILAAGISGLGFRDVGAAGVRGFEGPGALLTGRHDLVFPAGHGAALVDHPEYPPRMPEIARFLTAGIPCSEPQETASSGFQFASRVAQILAPIVAVAAVAAVVAAFIALLLNAGVWVAIAVVGIPLLLAYIGLRTV
ncbi:alpha/beta hydrolase [Microbacterium sp. 3J1]|uniref:alpha/beta hydrolase n=1 Tax=Microbacterium sp. 3J1 TaxID=861269 RepID=UPI000A4A62FC|nr:alpha/beta hydrolase [Microbacterium sp. 3J1]